MKDMFGSCKINLIYVNEKDKAFIKKLKELNINFKTK